MESDPLFVGRKYELRRLEEEALKPRASLIVLYGRRRIGRRVSTKGKAPRLK